MRSVSLAMITAVPAELLATVSVSDVSACAPLMILNALAARLTNFPPPEAMILPNWSRLKMPEPEESRIKKLEL